MMDNLTIASVNYMTPEYINVLLGSLHKTNPWYKPNLLIYDNGPTKTTIEGENYGYTAIHVPSNIYNDINHLPINNAPGCRNYASARHALTIQYIIDNTFTDYLMILDSDIIFTDSFKQLYSIFSRSPCIMCGYIRKPNGYNDRIAPWCTIMNLNKMRILNLRYYNKNRILYVNGNMKDDTGASILADCRRYKYPLIELPYDNMFYFHYKGGSYSDKPRVHQWINNLRKYWI